MDRREYERIRVNAKGTFIVKKEEQLINEFIAKIVDVSEKGIRIEVEDEESKSKALKIANDNIVMFQAMEEFELFKENTFEYFHGEVEIVHIEQDGNSIFLGCRLAYTPDSLKKYIEDRKVSIFISQMNMGIV